MTNIEDKMRDYVIINQKLIEFWREYPEGRIETAVVSHENGDILVKAEIFANRVDLKPIATGHAYEQEGKFDTTNTMVLENCETIAIGRALVIIRMTTTDGIRETYKPDANGEESKEVMEYDPGEVSVKWKDYNGKIKDLPPKRILWLAANYSGKDIVAKEAARKYLEQHPEILDKLGKSA